MNIHFKSDKQDWQTPSSIFLPLRDEFDLHTDVCASEGHNRLPSYWTPEQNGLAQDWSFYRCWMNPPYGRQIGLWTAKARTAELCVGLLPARTDTRWWHRDVLGVAKEIRFLKGRIKFVGAKHGAPFPSAVVVWRNDA